MRLESIYRYPVKGLTPERLETGRLAAGAGLPFDRHCAFTSGNLPDAPRAGGWVPARTFIQLTVYPELAKFRSRFVDDGPRLELTAPDGQVVTADLALSEGLGNVNQMIRSHFEAGPHCTPELHIQAPGHGHWDFTDTGVSVINLASVAELSNAAGEHVDPRRFRGNLFIEDLPAWAEFTMIGRRYRVGSAVIEMTRPARRCAATTVDLETADTGLNVPMILRKLTGHLYCGIYGRVVEDGDIRPGDEWQDLGPWQGNPSEDLPDRTPPPSEWPRFVRVEKDGNGRPVLRNLNETWPLCAGSAGTEIRVHPVGGFPQKMMKLTLAQPASADAFVCDASDSTVWLNDGAWLLVSGPY